MRVRLDAVPLRDPALGPAEILMSESQERMMAIVEPGDIGRVPGDLRQVGRAGHGDRRGNRRRQAGDDLARRAGRGHRAGQRRRRRAGVPASGGPPGRPGPAGRPATRPRCRARPPAPSCAAPCWPCSPPRAWPTRPGSPSSTTGTCAATPCSPCRRTLGRSGSMSGRTWAWPSPPTATAAIPGSTLTQARNSRWPRRTGTWRPPVRSRSPSPTASTSGRRRTPRSCGSSPRRYAGSRTRAPPSGCR